MVNGHPWMLVGPWYRWDRAGVPASGRHSAPVFQKFASDNFINEFLKNPQRSLKFNPDVDQVYNLLFEPARLTGGVLAGKAATLYPLDADGNTNPSRTKLVPSGMRKLFLPTHSRHYLVVCELHCDVPGFPSASSREVCQAGFVVRKRHTSYPAHAVSDAEKLLKAIVAVQAKLGELDETTPLRPRAAKRRAEKIKTMKAAGKFEPARAELISELKKATTALEEWKVDNGVFSIRQGWIPGAHERVGEWQMVDETPQQLREAWFPLYPLFADPAASDHDAAGRAIYFGVVPMSSFDADAGGKARFDDRSTYQIRCFVRRHDPGCRRKIEAPDCCGALVWSEPTECYRIASHFDLEGTSNRPITIQMPNLAELAAQAVKRPFGKYSPLKFIQPQSLQPETDGKSVSNVKGSMGGFQICFFSIPLITIVAFFVLNIFLPIVVFVFGLWFLLAFKVCIPPRISFSPGLQAELDALPSQIDADFSVQADLNLNGVRTPTTATQVNSFLRTKVAEDIETSNALERGSIDPSAKLGGFANSPLLELHRNNTEVAKMPRGDVSSDPPLGIDYTAALEFEERRELPGAAS